MVRYSNNHFQYKQNYMLILLSLFREESVYGALNYYNNRTL